jgi:hypothetical protein
MAKGEREVETDDEVMDGFAAAVASARSEMKEPYFGLVCITGSDGYVSFMRSMKACEGRHLREAAGLLLGYANRLTKAADEMEGERVFLVDRFDITPPTDPNAS